MTIITCSSCHHELEQKLEYCDICPHCNREEGFDDINTLVIDYYDNPSQTTAEDIACAYATLANMWTAKALTHAI